MREGSQEKRDRKSIYRLWSVFPLPQSGRNIAEGHAMTIHEEEKGPSFLPPSSVVTFALSHSLSPISPFRVPIRLAKPGSE